MMPPDSVIALWSVSEDAPWGADTATGTWAYRDLPTPKGADFSVSAQLRIDTPTENDAPIHAGSRVGAYTAGEDLGGYEAAVVLKGASGEVVRFQISTLWKEAMLWSARGGILQVRPFPFTTGQTYALRATSSGGHLTLHVDNQLVIDRWDTAAKPPVSAALARKEGDAWFGAASLQNAAPAGAPPAVEHKFAMRPWKGINWGFDGDEPIFALGQAENVAQAFERRDDCTGFEVKLVPGYLPQVFVPWFMQAWYGDVFRAGKLRVLTVFEQGDRLGFMLRCDDDGQHPGVSTNTQVMLSWDAAASVYRFDHESELVVDKGSSIRLDGVIDLVDPGFYNAVPSGSPKGRTWPTPHPYSIYQHKSGALYKQPHNHAGWFPGYGTTDYWQINQDALRPDGGFWAEVGDAVANPVVQLLESPDRNEFNANMCGVAFDVHIGWVPGGDLGGVVNPGSYKVKWRLTGVGGVQAQSWFSQASYPTPVDPSASWLLATGGVGNVDNFDRVVPQASPFGEYPWGPGALRDIGVGHGDLSSMRLDGPLSASTAVGDSLYTEEVREDTAYEVSAWVKTANVVGEGPGIFFGGSAYYPGIKGTTDWQRIGFVVRPSGALDSVSVALRNAGGGTVWFDDFLLRPMNTGESAAVGISNTPLPPDRGGQANLALSWTAAGALGDAANTLLDLSGHSHHGMLRDGARWVDEGTHRVLELDGIQAHVLAPGTPGLGFPKSGTLSMWVKPGDEHDDWNVIMSGGPPDGDHLRVLASGTAPYNLEVHAGDLDFAVLEVLPADTWSNVVLVLDATGRTMQLYLNGTKLSQQTWSGLGMEDGDVLRLGASGLGSKISECFQGRIASMILTPTVMTQPQIAALYTAGLP